MAVTVWILKSRQSCGAAGLEFGGLPVEQVIMGRLADALAAVRTPEKMQAAAKTMEQIKSMSSGASAASSGSTARQVFHEPFFQVLKGESTLGRMAWFQDYHKANFVKGTGRPLVHVCLAIGTIGYALEYVFHLQYQRHGVRDAHHGDAHGDAHHGEAAH